MELPFTFSIYRGLENRLFQDEKKFEAQGRDYTRVRWIWSTRFFLLLFLISVSMAGYILLMKFISLHYFQHFVKERSF